MPEHLNRAKTSASRNVEQEPISLTFILAMSHNPAMKISFSAIAIYLLMAIAAGAGLVANVLSIWEMSAIEIGWP